MRRALVVVLFFGGLVGLWQLATVSGRWSPVLLPPPLAILDYLWGALRDGTLLEATGVTLCRLFDRLFDWHRDWLTARASDLDL